MAKKFSAVSLEAIGSDKRISQISYSYITIGTTAANSHRYLVNFSLGYHESEDRIQALKRMLEKFAARLSPPI